METMNTDNQTVTETKKAHRGKTIAILVLSVLLSVSVAFNICGLVRGHGVRAAMNDRQIEQFDGGPQGQMPGNGQQGQLPGSGQQGQMPGNGPQGQAPDSRQDDQKSDSKNSDDKGQDNKQDNKKDSGSADDQKQAM